MGMLVGGALGGLAVTGAAIGAAAGVFLVAGLIYLLHALSWLLARILNHQGSVWVGYAITTAVLFVLAAVAGLVVTGLVIWIGHAGSTASWSGVGG
jgi:hypothetical protein